MRQVFRSWMTLSVALLCVSTGFGDEPKAKLSEADFKSLAPQLRLRGGMWDLPWQVSITEARRVAVQEKKLIFMIVNTGNCLGFV